MHSIGRGIAPEARSQLEEPTMTGCEGGTVNTTSALPVHPERLTAKSDTPSKTTVLPNRIRQDRPSADWTGVNQLRHGHCCSPHDLSMGPKFETARDKYAPARNRLGSWKPQLIQIIDLED